MGYLVTFVRFWYDFIVGDDWLVAAGVVVALAITFALAHAAFAAWWLLPVAVALVLGVSLWRVSRRVG